MLLSGIMPNKTELSACEENLRIEHAIDITRAKPTIMSISKELFQR